MKEQEEILEELDYDVHAENLEEGELENIYGETPEEARLAPIDHTEEERDVIDNG
jgi:hypothetical protein